MPRSALFSPARRVRCCAEKRWFGALTVALVLTTRQGHAWIFPEHADIAVRGIRSLSPEYRAALQTLWNEARAGHTSALCETLGRAPANADGKVSCLGFADLPAAAGDHSCSPSELYREATEATWLRDVVGVANVVEKRLRKATHPHERINAWNLSNIYFERVDTSYATRAGGNNAHFVPTTMPGETLDHYLGEAVLRDTPLNATGLYIASHLSALRFVAAYVDERDRAGSDATNVASLQRHARLALLSEAFALHFLEDSFASGHAVGIWGGAAMAKGTHDMYCLMGLPAHTWSGEAYSAFGDASMKPEDLRRAGRAVTTSLTELARVARDPEYRALVSASWDLENAEYMFEFNACREETLGFTVPALTAQRFTRSVWQQTVMPSPGERVAHLPRFRSEIGPFFSFKAGVDGGATFGGYFSDEDASPRASGDAMLAVGVGIGLEGLIGFTSDGLVQLGAGGTFSSRQYEPGCDTCALGVDGFVPARVPTRSGFLLEYRAPYWLIPGDLLLAAPVLLLAHFPTYKAMAITAASGGVLGLQTIVLTPAGTFQFMLGRELYVTIFNEDDPILRYDGGDPNLTSSFSLLTTNSLKFDAPFVAYQPLRSFNQTLTSSLTFQLGAAVDIPTATDVTTGEEIDPGIAYSVYLRLLLTSRWYFGSYAP